MLGTRDSITIPHLTQVGTLTQQSSEGNLQSSSRNPSRHEVESEKLLSSRKRKRTTTQIEEVKDDKMVKMMQQSQTFMRQSIEFQNKMERREREKDRENLLKLAEIK